jgi:hypothetical protein
MSAARLLADVVGVLHLAYVSFVVLGQLVIVAGLALRRPWARNFWFRTIHLAMIGIVVLESWAGMVCPLTTLEKTLRRSAGQTAYQADFIEYWVHRTMFFQGPSWVFSAVYTIFGLCVLATFILGSPRAPHRKPARPE